MSNLVIAKVTTIDLATGKEEDSRIIRYHLHSNRRWLIQHISWALSHGKGVAINNVKDDK
jgi:hypothetical protein